MEEIKVHCDPDGLAEHLKMRLVDYAVGDRSDWALDVRKGDFRDCYDRLLAKGVDISQEISYIKNNGGSEFLESVVPGI